MAGAHHFGIEVHIVRIAGGKQAAVPVTLRSLAFDGCAAGEGGEIVSRRFAAAVCRAAPPLAGLVPLRRIDADKADRLPAKTERVAVADARGADERARTFRRLQRVALNGGYC